MLEQKSAAASPVWTDLDLDKEGRQFGYFRLNISINDRETGFPIPVAIFKNGPGPRILLFGGVHGDEFEGQVMAMKLMRKLDIENVRGTLIIMNAANAPAAFAGQRNSPLDAQNLNRSFPGEIQGSPTRELAYFIDTELMPRVDYLLDFHSGGATDYVTPSVHVYQHQDPEKFQHLLKLLEVFAMPKTVILRGLVSHGKKLIGSCDKNNVLRFASELGGGAYITVDALRQAEAGLDRLLFHLGALKKPITNEPPPPTQLVRRLPNKQYVVAECSGLFEPYVEIDEQVKAGQPAAAIHFPEEPWREPRIHYFKEAGSIHCIRTRARTEIGDHLYMLDVPFTD